MFIDSFFFVKINKDILFVCVWLPSYKFYILKNNSMGTLVCE